MSQFGCSTSDGFSEEARGDLSALISETDLLNTLGLDSLPDDSFLDISVAGTCYLDPAEHHMNPVEPNELDQYVMPFSFQAPSVTNDDKRALINNLPMKTIGREKKSRPNRDLLPLSQSVGVGAPQKIATGNSKIALVYPLEATFRPRYKSDYFAQNGKNRKPRYVADREGNHFITLKFPVGIRGRVLVHWLTLADKSGERYLMPYRFQQSNASATVPDCNPLEVDIVTDKSGCMKLYLVLIKSKQDELKTLQPLQTFQPWKDLFNVPAKPSKRILNPKSLIKEYQLDQSQLAFTFCRLSPDGASCIPEWDTIVYSTVMKELPPDTSKTKPITCPRCLHQFDVTVNSTNGELEEEEETTSNKRTFDEYSDLSFTKQKSFKSELVYFH